MGAVVEAIVGGSAGTAVSVYQGEQQRKAATRNLRDQRAAQDRALASTLAQERRSAEEIARANRRAPDIGAQLVGAMEIAAMGGNRATLLRGTRPSVDPVAMQPSEGTLLGQ